MTGPFETSAQAFEAAAELREALRDVDPGGAMPNAVRQARRDAAVGYVVAELAAAGVELGAYDRRMAAWLAGWDGETIATILDWVMRARGARAAAAVSAAPGESTGCVHALASISSPACTAGTTPSPRCGGRGRTALFAADVTCPDCIAGMAGEGIRR